MGRRKRRKEITCHRLSGVEERYRKRKKSERTVRLTVMIILIAAVIAGIAAIYAGGKTKEVMNQASGKETEEAGTGTDTTADEENEKVQESPEKVQEGAQEETSALRENGQVSDAASESQEAEMPEEVPEKAAGEEWNYHTESRPKVKGIYVTGPMAGNGAFENLITLLDETELNAMVIDVKNDAGEITYQMPQETAQQIGACVSYIGDVQALISRLKEHGIYTIARIVCFKDPYLAEARPELALKTADGTPVVDGHGLAWVNPYREEVWQYLVDVAQKAAEAGFDEIQFDYVRFPIGTVADAAQYGVDMTVYTKKQAISGFLSYASEKLHATGIPVTADVFGTIIGNEIDVASVGQDYAELGSILDAVCPMVYPSHYGPGVFGLDVPDAKPYETILAAMTDSVEELMAVREEERAVVRPWLQAFTASWVDGYISYGGAEIRAQIQAVYDAGYEEWILWNAANRYSADGLLAE